MQRDLQFRNLYIKRSAVMSSIEMYMLREFDKPLPDYAKNFYTSEDLHRRSAFLQILAKQQSLRQIGRNSSSSVEIERVLNRLREKYKLWTDRELAELQALYADLFRQIQPFIQNHTYEDNDDNSSTTGSLSSQTDNNLDIYFGNIMADASTGNTVFDLLSETYAVVLRLL